jgi:hypothetical protein
VCTLRTTRRDNLRLDSNHKMNLGDYRMNLAILVALVSICCAQAGERVDEISTCDAELFDPSKCLYTRVESAKTMQEAEAVCVHAGGHLASVHTNAQHNTISLIGANSWIGLHDRRVEADCVDEDTEGKFTWTDGSPTEFRAWLEDEPNGRSDKNASCTGPDAWSTALPGRPGDCVCLTDDGQHWEDVPCDSLNDFVCQHCGAMPGPTEYKLYTFTENTLSMWNAEQACVREGGHLASIHSEADTEAIALLIAEVEAYTWIGFHDGYKEAGCTGSLGQTGRGNDPIDYSTGFMWTDGTSTDYTAWANGEPNDWSKLPGMNGAHCDGSGGEDCSFLCPATKGPGWCPPNRWADTACTGADPAWVIDKYVCGFNGAWPRSSDFNDNPLAQGSKACHECPDGMLFNFTKDDGGERMYCVECTPGKSARSLGLAMYNIVDDFRSGCVDCEAGHYDHDMDGTTACAPCPMDTYQDKPGAIGCITCRVGHTSVPGSSSCCPAGTIQDVYNVYSKTGWCLGGPGTQSSTYPTSVDGCWAACLIDYPNSLVAADYWPKNDLRGFPKCWCQTKCVSLSTQNVDSNNPVELALRVGWESDLNLPRPELAGDGGLAGITSSCSPCVAPYYDLDQLASTPCAPCPGETCTY